MKKKQPKAPPGPLSANIWTRGVQSMAAMDSSAERWPRLFGAERWPDLFGAERWPDLFGAERGSDIFRLGSQAAHIPVDRWPDLFGTGYVRDRADIRDHGLERVAQDTRDISAAGKLKGFSGLDCVRKPLPRSAKINMEASAGKVSHQGPVQCCTAHAVATLAEFHLLRSTRRQHRLSVLFLYKVARELLGVDGDRGCTLRETFKALRKYGCVPEQHWPYAPPWLEKLPRVADFELAEDLAGMSYARLDRMNQTGDETLKKVLEVLAAGFPIAFGFTLYGSIDQTGKDAVIPMPPATKGDPQGRVLGGHAVLATGYRITSRQGAATLEGDLQIRNSWGTSWGQRGYGWLPFGYVTKQLARDFWVLYPSKGD